MAIILRLDRVMADRKISLKDLAEQVGIANINLSKIKTGKIRQTILENFLPESHPKNLFIHFT